MATLTAPAPVQVLRRSEILLSLSLLGLLVIFIVPLPTAVLDALLAMNLSATILLLLITLTVRQPLDFSTFPSLLLLMTLFRLALNVATTRLILLDGHAGEIVNAFGNFVVRGNLVVGLVIFSILIIIQFVVITKGAGRVSEVAARFTLDAMPGKQMAIDAEMNAGLIDETEAKRRRQNLVRESEFYGTMDGASRFVRGDAIAAVIITAVNLIGGFVVGLMKGQSFAAAIKTYSILTIGDGLITQIPALITATASGLLVTKATSGSSLGQELGDQAALSVAPFRLGSLVIAGLAVFGGLPWYIFMPLAVGLFVLSVVLARPAKPKPAAADAAAPADAPAPAAKSPLESLLDDFVQTDRIGLEIGVGLVSLVNTRRGPGLLDRIGGLRKDLAKQSGLWVPAVRVRDNVQLDAQAYRILIGGREVARGELRPDHWLAIDPGGTTKAAVPGEDTREPAFGLPAKWVADADRPRAEVAGYTVVDATNVAITHLGEIVRKHAHELLSREDLKALLDKVKETSPAIVEEVVPNIVTMGTLHRVLAGLLEERVPISHMTRILESLSAYAPTVKDVGDLTERVRADLGRSICDRFRDATGRVRAIVLDPRLEIELRRATQNHQLALDGARLEQLILRVASEWRKATVRGIDPIVACDASLRRALRHALSRSVGDVSVVAYQEIPVDLLMEPITIIRPDELAGAPPAVAEPDAGRGARP